MTACVAITGGTGFVGRHVAAALCEAGYGVRSLSRSGVAPAPPGLTLVAGALESEASLRALVQGAQAVVHIAGAIRAVDRAGFQAVNAGGSARVAAAAEPGRMLIQVSSLAARAPGLSDYAASKADGEQAVLRHVDRMTVVVVRPPAVYGPHDRSTLPILRGLDRGWLLHPAGRSARFSMLYASDLAALIVALLANPPGSGTIVEPDDGRGGGYAWSELAGIAAAKLARPVRAVGVPQRPLTMLAGLSERVAVATGRQPFLSRGKVRELFHPDWVCGPSGMASVAGWQPRTRFEDGLPATLGWYRAAGWL